MFKVFKNEFKRLIKMRMVTVLAVFLILITLISLKLYSPIIKPNTNLDFNDATSNQIYATFIIDNNYKSNYDAKIEDAKNLLDYYSNLHVRSDNSNQLLQNIFLSFDNLENEITKGDAVEIENKNNEFLQSLMSFKLALLNFSQIDNIDYIQKVIYYNEYENSLTDLNTLLEKVNEYRANITNASEAANAVVSFFRVNSYQEKLSNLNLNSMNFLEITISSLILKLENDFRVFSDYITQTTESTFNKSYANTRRISLLNKIIDFHEFFYSIIKSPYLTVFAKNELVVNLDESLISAYTAINLQGVHQESLIAYKSAVKRLNDSNLTHFLQEFAVQHILVQPSNSTIHDLNVVINYHLTNNIPTLYQNIQNLQQNDDPALIVAEIEKYRDMANMAYDLVNYATILDSSKVLHRFKIYECYGSNLSNFNEYEYKSYTTLYTYLITNNEFLQDYSLPNQFNVVSGSVNSNDYAVFALKIAAILIVIILVFFAVILFPVDTKKGRINFLLVRPLSRPQIFFGKYFALLTLGIVYYMLSLITVVLYSSFAATVPASSMILLVFNATHIVKLSPMFLVLTFSICLFLEMVFYLSVIMLVAVIFKKSASLSVLVSFVSLAILQLLNFVSGTQLASAFLPNSNINFYKYFLTSSNFEQSNIFYKLLHSPMVSNMNIFIGLVVFAVYITMFFIISLAILGSRDYN